MATSVKGHPLATATQGSGDPRKLFGSADYRNFTLIDRVARKQPNYFEQQYGTAYPWVGDGENPFPTHKLVYQEEEQDGEHVLRYYDSDWPEADQQPSNAVITFSGESAAHPIYTRQYLLPRRTFVPTTRLTPLFGLSRTSVTSGGSGYDQNSVATLSGGTGSGGVVKCFVNPAGAVIDLQILTAGSYTVAPTVSISGGTGAVVGVSIQPATCVLVKEGEVALSDPHVTSLYIGVRRVYETLPGPYRYGTQIDETTEVIVHYRKRLVAGGTSGGITTEDGITYYTEVIPTDDITISVEIGSWIVESDLPEDVTFPAMVEMQVSGDTFAVTALNASSGVQEAHGASVARTAGARGGVFCNVTEMYLSATELAAFASTLGTGALIPRRIVSGSTAVVYSGILEVTSFDADFSGHAQTFAVDAPVNDVISGTVVALRVEQMRFGVYHVTLVKTP